MERDLHAVDHIVNDLRRKLREANEKVEKYEDALTKIATRKMSIYLSSSHMNRDFIKIATEALNSKL